MTSQRILLIVLLAWALVMIVPDVLRVVQPLGSFGFYANNDGLIYGVIGPFDEKEQSPAWNAGIRAGECIAILTILILFVLRAPDGEPDPKWQWLERALPGVGALLALLLLASYGSLTGYRTETGTRLAILTGFVVAIVPSRSCSSGRGGSRQNDYQRLRWVIWGCVIGLPAFLVAELASTTTIFDTSWGTSPRLRTLSACSTL